MSNYEAVDLFNRWAGVIHDAKRNFIRYHGYQAEWLLLSRQTWEEIKTALNFMMRYAALIEPRKPSEVFGLKVAIIDTPD